MQATLQRAADAAAHAFLSRLLELGPLPETVIVSHACGSGPLVVTVRISTCAEKTASRLTPCSRDVLTVVGYARHPLTTSAVLRALEAAGMIWGERTVRGSLARLVREGALANRQRPPRGYHLPGAF